MMAMLINDDDGDPRETKHGTGTDDGTTMLINDEATAVFYPLARFGIAHKEHPSNNKPNLQIDGDTPTRKQVELECSL